ncbi:hypothetical protein [Phytomonospora endophytica]|uniref:Uncharacterized protein n=1 Tax=Phytomonospora endophytica TaxID=714109 RepID=A0A841FXE8_9ACTN|nr:hypothetical protein [Phytomonospora endophytica]MBB6038027.1 hypothetical protein [Phytomonospora endophytica]GIG68928.1 hypothetical protein Pen01_52230 [Phytomonospora endophytica]
MLYPATPFMSQWPDKFVLKASTRDTAHVLIATVASRTGPKPDGPALFSEASVSGSHLSGTILSNTVSWKTFLDGEGTTMLCLMCRKEIPLGAERVCGDCWPAYYAEIERKYYREQKAKAARAGGCAVVVMAAAGLPGLLAAAWFLFS